MNLGLAEFKIHFGLGYFYWKRHKDEEAEREFRIETARDPARALVWAYLGDTLLRQDKPDEAVPALEKALQLDPQCRMAHVGLGLVSIDRKDCARAKAELDKAVRLDPAKSDAHFQLARLYRAMGREAEARAEFEILQRLKQNEKEDELHKLGGRALKLENPQK